MLREHLETLGGDLNAWKKVSVLFPERRRRSI